MKNRLRIAVLIGTSLLALASGAQAQASATAELTNFHVSLIDLDVRDDVDPWVTFIGGAAVTAFGSNNDRLYRLDEVGAVGASLSASIGPVDGMSGSGVVTGGDPFTSGNGPSAKSSTYAAGNKGTGLNSTGGVADILSEGMFSDGGFWLSANTQVTFSAIGSAQVSRTRPDHDSSFAGAYLAIRSEIWGGEVSKAFVYVGGGDDAALADIPIQVSFYNHSDSPVRAYASAETWAYAFADGLPIPEPRTSGLMIAGLAAISLKLRRRAQ